jgi:hypothetical protein
VQNADAATAWQPTVEEVAEISDMFDPANLA